MWDFEKNSTDLSVTNRKSVMLSYEQINHYENCVNR